MVVDMCLSVLFVKQKTAYEMRISDWSSDVCSSDLPGPGVAGARGARHHDGGRKRPPAADAEECPQGLRTCRATGCEGFRRLPPADGAAPAHRGRGARQDRSERASCRERVCQYV